MAGTVVTGSTTAVRVKALVLAVLASTAMACTAPAPMPSRAPEPAAWRVEMLAEVNAARAAAGARPLSTCGNLEVAAQLHSEDQAANSQMSHTGSDGSTPWDRMRRAGYVGWTAAAENVAYGQADEHQAMDAWMASSGHRANILEPSYTHLGMGMALGADGRPYWTQDFGTNGTC